MQKDNYDNDEVAIIINRDFIPVRVDTDQRPDINERYNQGGWPTTAFLDAEGRIITGATYVPREQLLGMLEQVRTFVQHDGQGREPSPPLPLGKGVVTEEICLGVEDLARGYFDSVHGGFGEPKFPMPELLEFLLLRHQRTKDRGLLRMVEGSLGGILRGLEDRVEGGFFRYAVTRDWSIPHYEKMLDTNAGLLRVLALAHTATGTPAYREAVERTVHYLQGTLAARGGGLFASQDADGEDLYYGRPLQERKQMPTPAVDKSLYADLNGLGLRGLAAAYPLLKSKELRSLLEKTGGLLVKDFIRKGEVAHAKGQWLGWLRDHVNVGMGLLEAGKALEEPAWEDQARAIAQRTRQDFLEQGGALWDSLGRGEGKLAMREQRLQDNARGAIFFLALGDRATAESILQQFTGDYRAYGLLAGEYGIAVERFLLAEGG